MRNSAISDGMFARAKQSVYANKADAASSEKSKMSRKAVAKEVWDKTDLWRARKPRSASQPSVRNSIIPIGVDVAGIISESPENLVLVLDSERTCEASANASDRLRAPSERYQVGSCGFSSPPSALRNDVPG
eukprot:scaffold92756_cov43-Prasinocladus_malaysianus.AAC.1